MSRTSIAMSDQNVQEPPWRLSFAAPDYNFEKVPKRDPRERHITRYTAGGPAGRRPPEEMPA